MIITYHAHRRMVEREIDLDELFEALRAPERAVPSDSDETCFVFYKHVRDRLIKVVFSFRDGVVTVKTIGDDRPRASFTRYITVSSGVIACAALHTRRGAVKVFDGELVETPDAGSTPARSIEDRAA